MLLPKPDRTAPATARGARPARVRAPRLALLGPGAPAGDRRARSLLGTILGDAAAHKPPLIPYNPALRPRNRGRKTGRRLARSPQRAWVTPLQALLMAERAALLTGRDDDFTLILTLAYTGLFSGRQFGHAGLSWGLGRSTAGQL